jgi:putative ABC transport system permease protein
MVPVLGGLGIGVGASVVAGRALAGLLFEVPATDPITLVAVPSLLTAVALSALAIPAFRAGRMDPAHTLRED